MSRMMLIDATHPEQTRVVVTDKNRVVEFDVEANSKKQTVGNIYLAKITRVEPSLQAAFVEYGAGKQGFLPFGEIHPDYYQIPVEDRQRILEEEARALEEQERFDTEREVALIASQEAKHSAIGYEDNSEDNVSDTIVSNHYTEDDSLVEQDEIEVGVGETTKLKSYYYQKQKRYKIQEVIKKRQILLIQVVKGERGTKGASLTTYLSLAGRYCVLMPNTARGGGISRKITQAKDRQELKKIAQSLDVPKGMGLIIRTAGANRTKIELKRDFEYLMRLWDSVRDLTLESIAPSMVYEEGNLVKRAIRDIYSKDIPKILVQGDAAYREAKEFMKMLMPSHARCVQHYKEALPLFSSYNVEKQLDELSEPIVQLKSGGYLVINQTEALVAIDINSGRSTNEFSVEDTALKTNLEAADEIARQLRLRDLAGLIVIDFIDMEDGRNVRSVERRIKDVLKLDKARIQVARISNFGLMEMTRQRLRPAMQEILSNICPHCKGAGYVVSLETAILRVMRRILEEVIIQNPATITAKTSFEIANFLLNKKRAVFFEMETTYNVQIIIEGSTVFSGNHFDIHCEARVDTEGNIVKAKPYSPPVPVYDMELDIDIDDIIEEGDITDSEDNAKSHINEETPHRKHRKRRFGLYNEDITVKNEDVVKSASDYNEEKQASDRHGRGKRRGRDNISEKMQRGQRRGRGFRHYLVTPDIYTTDSGVEVLIENPVSVLEPVIDAVLQDTKFQEEFEPCFQNDAIITPETYIMPLDSVWADTKPQDDIIQDNIGVKDNIDVKETDIPETYREEKSNDLLSSMKEIYKVEGKEQPKMEDLPAIPSDILEFTVDEALDSEKTETKQARRGWWRNRFGV